MHPNRIRLGRDPVYHTLLPAPRIKRVCTYEKRVSMRLKTRREWRKGKGRDEIMNVGEAWGKG
jgi:hypothetical protein